MEDSIEKFPCRRCHKKFSALFSVRKHEQICGITSSPQICEICKCAYKNIHSLRTHRTRCSVKRKKYECTLCRISFSMKFLFRQHMKSQHGDDMLLSSKTRQSYYKEEDCFSKPVKLQENEDSKDNYSSRIGIQTDSSTWDAPLDTSETILPDNGNIDEIDSTPDIRSMYFEYESSSDEETGNFSPDYRL